jgi:S-adenosylmethionine:tRNA ribosyltransferase-isomerase
MTIVLVSDFDYLLPPELIAQHPAAGRSAARMLHMQGEELRDTTFTELPALLRPGDLVVFNDTRVFPARLYGHRRGRRAQPLSPHNPASRDFLHGRVEVLLTRRLPSSGQGQGAEEQLWRALVRPGRKIMPGERLFFGSEEAPLLEAEVVERGEFGERVLRFLPVADFFARLEELGHVPLPPYIDRPDTPADRERYQTVFARETGSVAAPTAALHFTPEILERIRERGIETATVTLHVGLGTFAPIRTEVVEEHKMHTEWYQICEGTANAISRARQQGRRVVAVGTTTVRTLEYAAGLDPEGRITAHSGEADIFIFPGYRFRVVDAMLTNFHLPKSTLLMLICAFAGRERVLRAYEHAVRERYRFFSYGDCMFVEK